MWHTTLSSAWVFPFTAFPDKNLPSNNQSIHQTLLTLFISNLLMFFFREESLFLSGLYHMHEGQSEPTRLLSQRASPWRLETKSSSERERECWVTPVTCPLASFTHTHTRPNTGRCMTVSLEGNWERDLLHVRTQHEPVGVFKAAQRLSRKGKGLVKMSGWLSWLQATAVRQRWAAKCTSTSALINYSSVGQVKLSLSHGWCWRLRNKGTGVCSQRSRTDPNLAL